MKILFIQSSCAHCGRQMEELVFYCMSYHECQDHWKQAPGTAPAEHLWLPTHAKIYVRYSGLWTAVGEATTECSEQTSCTIGFFIMSIRKTKQTKKKNQYNCDFPILVTKKGKRGGEKKKAYTCLRLENYPFSKIVRTIHKIPPRPLEVNYWIPPCNIGMSTSSGKTFGVSVCLHL